MSTEAKWTPEPWRQGDGGMIYGGKAYAMIANAFDGLGDHATDASNARRIIECVNALAGIPDPAAFVARAREIEKAARLCLPENFPPTVTSDVTEWFQQKTKIAQRWDAFRNALSLPGASGGDK